MNCDSKKTDFVRWSFPAIPTLLLILLVENTSEPADYCSRYTGTHFSLILAFGVLAWVCWWVAWQDARYERFCANARSVPRLGLIGVGVLLLVALDVSPALDLLFYVLVLLTLLIAILALENLRTAFQNFGLVVVSCALGVYATEFLFRTLLVKDLVPKDDAGFEKIIASEWQEPISLEKEPGTFRILGLSDSFGFFGGEHNYHYVLEKIAREEGYKVEVVNFSMAGYQPLNELEILRRFGARYEPDLVLHGFFVGNDFRMPRAQCAEFNGLSSLGGTGLAGLRPSQFGITQWFRSCRFLQENAKALRKEREGGQPVGVFAEEFYLRMQRDTLTASFERDLFKNTRWPETVPILDSIREETEEMGAEYVMVIHPDSVQVEPVLFERLLSKFELDGADYDLNMPQHHLNAHTSLTGAKCLDLLPVFRAEGAHGGLYDFRDSHYSTKGHATAAREILRFLKNERILPATSH